MQHAKPMLSIEEQLDHLAEKGITFNLASREEAGEYLASANNYFRLTAYRMLFPNLSDTPGVDLYKGVDFAHLSEVASIDNRLRYVLLHMTLDVEHYAKVRLLNRALFYDEDGFAIIEGFRATARGNRIIKDISTRHEQNEYTGDLYRKYKDEMPMWVFFELLGYTHLCRFYEYCGTRWDDLMIADEGKILTELITIRNAIAHSNCLLNDIDAERRLEGSSVNSVSYKLYNSIPDRAMVLQIKENLRLTQISLLFLLHKSFAVGTDSRERMGRELALFRVDLDECFAMFEDFNSVTRRFKLLCDLITLWETA